MHGARPVGQGQASIAAWWGRAGSTTPPWSLWRRQVLHIWHEHRPLCFPEGFAHLNPSKACAKPQKTARTTWEAPSKSIIQGLHPSPPPSFQAARSACLRKLSHQIVKRGNLKNAYRYRKKEKQTSLRPNAHFNLEMNIISPLLIANTGHCLNETICICYLIRPMFFKWGKNNPLGYKPFLWGSFLSFNLVSCWVL